MGWGEGRDILVQNPQVLIRLTISLIMLDRTIQSDGLEGGFLPRGHNVPPDAAVRQMIQRGEALRQEKRWLERRR